MSDTNKHTLKVAYEGATDKLLIITYKDDASLERAREILCNMPLIENYPHHPVWNMQGALSGVFCEGVSGYHVANALADKADIVVKAKQAQLQDLPTLDIQPA